MGNLTGGSLVVADYTSGSTNGVAEPTLQYDEVGSFTLTTNVNDYLVPGFNVDLTAPDVIVGRFTPASFRLVSIADGDYQQTCNSTFTYLGQQFSYDTNPSFVVEALAADNTVTENYIDSFARLVLADASFTYPTQDAVTLVAVSNTPALGSRTLAQQQDR